MPLNQSIQSELNEALRKLHGLERAVRKEVRSDLKAAAGLMLSSVKARVPVGTKPHKRYSTPKVSRKLRAPKGLGKVVAVYKPGNLKRSFNVLTFSRSEAVFVGPKVGKMPDGYYGHFVEFGTPHQQAQGYVNAAVQTAGPTALKYAAQLIQRRVEQYAAQIEVK